MRIKVRFYFGHVRTYSWLHKLRNSQGEIYGTYLGNICGIYKEYIRNIHKYLWYKIIRNKEHRGATNGAAASRPPHWGCVRCFCLFYIINIYGYSFIYTCTFLHILFEYSLYILYISHIYFLNIFHTFSLVCFLISGVNKRLILIAKPRLFFS